MRHFLFAFGALVLAQPAPAQDITDDVAYVLRCHFSRSCSGGGCGEENHDILLEVEGAGATLRDETQELALSGGIDTATGQVSFVSEPADNASYFVSVFEEGGALMTIHTQAEGKPLGITFDGACWEDS